MPHKKKFKSHSTISELMNFKVHICNNSAAQPENSLINSYQNQVYHLSEMLPRTKIIQTKSTFSLFEPLPNNLKQEELQQMYEQQQIQNNQTTIAVPIDQQKSWCDKQQKRKQNKQQKRKQNKQQKGKQNKGKKEVICKLSDRQNRQNTKQFDVYSRVDLSQQDCQKQKKIKSIMRKILMRNFTDQLLEQFQSLISHSIKIGFIPEPKNNLGIKLLASGKFIVAYYQILLRGENNPLLIDHILKSIHQKLCITEDKYFFESVRKCNQAKKQKYVKFMLGIQTESKQCIRKNRSVRSKMMIKR